MRKLFVFLLLGLFIISFASSLEIDNTFTYDSVEDKIIFKNRLGIELIGGGVVAEAQLEENICTDGRFCHATKTITLYEEGELIQDFKTLRIDDDSWEEQDIRWHKLEYWGDINDYENQKIREEEICIDTLNLTECHTQDIYESVKIGSHKGWIRFKEGDIFKVGTYEVKTSGEIKPGRIYDWQVKINGDWTTPWAIWGNISLGDDAEVILNSPADEEIIFNNLISFNTTANITNGATIINMSLWTNESEGWEISNTQTIEDWGIYLSSTSSSNIEYDGTQYTGSSQTYAIVYNHTTIINEYIDYITMLHKGSHDNYAWDFYVKWYYVNGTTINGAVTSLAGNSGIGQVYQLRTHNNPIDSSLVSYYVVYGRSDYSGPPTQYIDEQNIYGYPATSVETIINDTITDDIIWNVQACDSDGDCGFATSNYTVSLDSQAPSISVESPTETIDYGAIGSSETLNLTFTDTNLDSCWYNYNGTNISIEGCQTGVKNSTQFTLESGDTNMTIYANDSVGNLNSTLINWSYTYLENNRTHNTNSYETASESFNINVQGATSATLFYNGTEYTTTKSGNNFNRTIQIPVGQLGNNSIYWKFDGVTNSQTTYQNVSETIFTLCNSTYSTTFLNISFKDEEDLSIINASIPTSTFEYWLGDGTVKKTYNLINNTDNFNYEFCATPNQTFNFNSLIQYKQGSTYPQRIFSQDGGTLTNSTTDLTLYLLSVSDGLFVTFQVFGGQSNALEGVSVSGTRVLDGSDQLVAQGTTDAAGTVTFWINPDFLHTLTFIKTGVETVIESIFPTQTLYTINMGQAGGILQPDNSEGITQNTFPAGSYIDSNTFYTFTYVIDSSVLTLTEYGFELFYNNGTSIYSSTGSTSTGGTLDKSFNVSDESRITMDYYYIVNDTRKNGTTYWLVYTPGDFSIYHLFNRVDTYISADMLGVLGDDNGYFTKAMFSILLLILVTGTLSLRYGLGSEAAVTGLLFGVLFMLNIFNLIPTPDFISFISLGDFLVFIIALYAITTIIKEEGR